MLMLVIVIGSYVRVQKTAATGPIDLSRLLWRQPCRLQESRMMQATRLPLQTSDPWSTEVLSSDSADGSGMDEFGYLAVILSIILGLSVTQLLQGLSNVINARDRVRLYWRRSDGRCCFWSSICKHGGPCLDYVTDMLGPFFSLRFFCLRRSCSTSSRPSPCRARSGKGRWICEPITSVTRAGFRLVRDCASGQHYEKCCN